MRRMLLLTLLVLVLAISGCSSQNPEPSKNVSEQEVRNAVTELINGINNGNTDAVKKYIGTADPVAEKLVSQLKNNIKLSSVKNVKIEGSNAQATVSLEIIPLNVNKDITLNFNISDVLLLNNPLGLLSLLL